MHRFLIACALACASLGGVVAPSAASEPGDPMLAEVGAETFKQYCASCHGADGGGDGPVASTLKKPPADLTRIAERRGGVFPDAEIARWIDGRFDAPAHGTREMPVWGLDYTIQASEALPELPYNQAVYVRTRIMSLLEYLNQLQGK